MTQFSMYKGKTVLVTGHTGFKGSWMCAWLYLIGARVVGFSDTIVSSPSHYDLAQISTIVEDYWGDISDENAIREVVIKTQPDFIFHMAAQSLVRDSYEFPAETMLTNAIGTARVLDSLRSLDKPVVGVFITSDKAYDNVEWPWGYRENDALGGKDPYSASKGMAELAFRSFFESYFNKRDCNIRLGVTRAGNVIGGGD